MANLLRKRVSTGTNSSLFSLSLQRAFRRGPHVDFVHVEGLPGIYLANRLGLSALEDAAFRYDAGVTDYEKYVRSEVSALKISCHGSDPLRSVNSSSRQHQASQILLL